MGSWNEHGIALCRHCQHPVAAPVGLFERELFHVARCPWCRGHHPHPKEADQLRQTKWMAVWGAVILIATVALIQMTPVELLVIG